VDPSKHAENQALFRSVNEAYAADGLLADGDRPHEFVCECSQDDCFERLVLTMTEYEGVRSDSRAFFVAPGHEEPEVEATLEWKDRYLVVRKMGDAGEIAEELDERAAG
jgi:hypothetical protein